MSFFLLYCCASFFSFCYSNWLLSHLFVILCMFCHRLKLSSLIFTSFSFFFFFLPWSFFLFAEWVGCLFLFLFLILLVLLLSSKTIVFFFLLRFIGSLEWEDTKRHPSHWKHCQPGYICSSGPSRVGPNLTLVSSYFSSSFLFFLLFYFFFLFLLFISTFHFFLFISTFYLSFLFHFFSSSICFSSLWVTWSFSLSIDLSEKVHVMNPSSSFLLEKGKVCLSYFVLPSVFAWNSRCLKWPLTGRIIRRSSVRPGEPLIKQLTGCFTFFCYTLSLFLPETEWRGKRWGRRRRRKGKRRNKRDATLHLFSFLSSLFCILLSLFSSLISSFDQVTQWHTATGWDGRKSS